MNENITISIRQYDDLKKAQIKLDLLVNAIFDDAQISTSGECLWLRASDNMMKTIFPDEYKKIFNKLLAERNKNHNENTEN